MCWDLLSIGTRKALKGQRKRCATRHGQLVARWLQLPFKECLPENEGSKSGQIIIFSTALNDSVNWPCSVTTLTKVSQWESKILRLTLRPRVTAGKSCVNYRKRTSRTVRAEWRKMTMAEKNVEKIWTWAVYDGEVPVLRALRPFLGWRTTTWWRNRSALGHEDGPDERDKMETQVRVPQQRSAVGYSDVEVGGRRKRLDTAHGTRTAPQGRCDHQSPENDEATDGAPTAKRS